MKKLYVVLAVFLLFGGVIQSRAQNLLDLKTSKDSKDIKDLPKDILYKNKHVLVEETIPGKILSITVLDFNVRFGQPDANPIEAIKEGIKMIGQLNKYEIVDIKDINGEWSKASVTVGVLVFIKPKSDR